ncbi:MAG: hypothetical protein M0Q14_08485 [Tissierellaceae bacterium]|nr:hypothetical protein [Tissierellaceae bacterium]
MINFLTAYWDSLLVIAIVVIVMVIVMVLVKKGYSNYAKQILFYLVTKAEAEFAGGTGLLKYAAVTTWLYDKLPALAKFVLTQKTIDSLIEEAVQQMKRYLAVNEQAKVLVAQNIVK